MRNIDEWFSKRVHLLFIVEMNSSLFSITRQGQVKLNIESFFLFLKHSLKRLNRCNLKKFLTIHILLMMYLGLNVLLKFLQLPFIKHQGRR